MTADEIERPEFEKAQRVHDWRNYVSPAVRDMWGTFTAVQRRAIAEMCDELAGREDWD